MKIVFGAGGTGGHIIPALAIASAMSANGWEPHFVGNADSLEERLVNDRHYPFHAIRVQKLHRKLTVAHLRFGYLLAKSIFECRRIIRQIGPDAVLCTGSYISGPIALAALWARIPLFLHESNSYPGLTVRYLAKYAKVVFISWDRAQQFLRRSNNQMVGTPICNHLFIKEDMNWEVYGLSAHRPKILISGGSQGSAVINDCVDSCVEQIVDLGYDLIWQTGKITYRRYADKYSNHPQIYLFDFNRVLPSFMMHAHIAITRAGAITLAELEVAKCPSILIPLPSSAANHQYWNAFEQQSKGFALMIEQNRLNPAALTKAIIELTEKRQSLRDALEKLPPNTASADIAATIEHHIERREDIC